MVGKIFNYGEILSKNPVRAIKTRGEILTFGSQNNFMKVFDRGLFEFPQLSPSPW